jgi:predicted nuclease with TOPRIM domain
LTDTTSIGIIKNTPTITVLSIKDNMSSHSNSQELKGLQSQLTKIKSEIKTLKAEQDLISEKKKLLEEKAKNINQKIKQLENNLETIVVSEHALLRFVELKLGITSEFAFY